MHYYSNSCHDAFIKLALTRELPTITHTSRIYTNTHSLRFFAILVPLYFSLKLTHILSTPRLSLILSKMRYARMLLACVLFLVLSSTYTHSTRTVLYYYYSSLLERSSLCENTSPKTWALRVVCEKIVHTHQPTSNTLSCTPSIYNLYISKLTLRIFS